MGKPVLDKITVAPKERPEDEQKFNLHMKQVNLHLQTRTIEEMESERIQLLEKVSQLDDLMDTCREELLKVLAEAFPKGGGK